MEYELKDKIIQDRQIIEHRRKQQQTPQWKKPTLTWIHAPVFNLHRLQMRDQRLGGMWETLVMGSIRSGQAMLTYTIKPCATWWEIDRQIWANGGYAERDKYLWYPQGTAHMRPLGPGTCGLHGTALLRTQQALRVDAEDTCPTKPVSNRNFNDAITSLWRQKRVRTHWLQSSW